jgi:hypothetical protein
MTNLVPNATVSDIEDDDAFANFAAVVFAAYCETTIATPDIVSKYKSDTSCLSLINQFWGTSASSPVKPVPKLNLGNSCLFRRRAEALVAKDPLPAVPVVPAVHVVLNSKDNFAKSGLMQRRAAAKAAADAIVIASS